MSSPPTSPINTPTTQRVDRVEFNLSIPKSTNITNENSKHPYTAYSVSITHVPTNKTWEIVKRYSQFAEFHEGLKKTLPSQVPEFPPKSIPLFDDNMSREFISKRKEDLERYLQTIILNSLTRKLPLVQMFFEIKKNIQVEGRRETVVVPLPDFDFDITEVAVVYHMLKLEGFRVVFATERGNKAQPMKLKSTSWDALEFYSELDSEESFNRPIRFSNINAEEYDAIYLSGGHSSRIKPYLDSAILQSKVLNFWNMKKIIAAISYGVVLLARCKSSPTSLSIIHNKRITTLPKYLEGVSGMLGSAYNVFSNDSCEEIVRAFLADQDYFEDGPINFGSKGSLYSDENGFCVEDENILTARWHGDTYNLAKKLIQKLSSQKES